MTATISFFISLTIFDRESESYNLTSNSEQRYCLIWVIESISDMKYTGTQEWKGGHGQDKKVLVVTSQREWFRDGVEMKPKSIKKHTSHLQRIDSSGELHTSVRGQSLSFAPYEMMIWKVERDHTPIFTFSRFWLKKKKQVFRPTRRQHETHNISTINRQNTEKW